MLARSRMQHAYAQIQPAGVKSGAVARALPEAVRAVQREHALGAPAALGFIADRAAEYAKSKLAQTTPLQYRPHLATWLDKRLLDPPGAWDVEHGGGNGPVIRKRKRQEANDV
jgi:hypothetical protein